tara:strand:- start:104 stop:397 length:294 start_codon:yes stop_codon:yes gene_type:complete
MKYIVLAPLMFIATIVHATEPVSVECDAAHSKVVESIEKATMALHNSDACSAADHFGKVADFGSEAADRCEGQAKTVAEEMIALGKDRQASYGKICN